MPTNSCPIVLTIALALSGLLCLENLSAVESTSSTVEGLVLKPPAIPDEVTGGLRSLNEKLSHNVKPSENSAVLLTQLFGEVLYEPILRDASLEMLGIERLSTTAPRIQYVEPFVRSQGTTDPEEIARQAHLIERQIFAGANHAWKQEEYPELFAFLTANRAALDFLRTVSEKEKYYAPMLSTEEPPQLLTASLALERRLPFVVQVLCARALLRVNSQQVPAGMDDLLTCQKLAVLLAKGSPFDVSGSKAHLMDSMANHAAILALASGHVEGAQAKYYLTELKRVPRLPSAAIAADQGERAILHQELEFLSSSTSSVREFFDLPDEEKFESLAKINLSDLPWDKAAERADEIQNRFVKAISLSDRAERKTLTDQLDQEFVTWTETSEESNRALAESSGKDLAVVTRWIGETMAMSLRPWYVQRAVTDESARVRRDLVTIGMALVAYRSDREQFPRELSDLTPEYLDKVPNDAHSDQPYAYTHISNDQARLVSLGANRQDDAGQGFNDDRILELKWAPGENRN